MLFLLILSSGDMVEAYRFGRVYGMGTGVINAVTRWTRVTTTIIDKISRSIVAVVFT